MTTQHAWQPSASLEDLRQRANLIRVLREHFWQRGFWEVETPLLSRDTVVDRHLDPPSVTPESLGLGQHLPGAWYLQTSPEFGMKRLLAAGAGRIFQIGKAFRGGESGALHNPEFTMLEWYDPQADYESGMRFLEELASCFFNVAGCQRLSYEEAWCAAISETLGTSRESGERFLREDSVYLRSLTTRLMGMTQAQVQQLDHDSLLIALWSELVEPNLGKHTPALIYDWPASQAALARTRWSAGWEVAERFELYYHGVELANGYHELVDPEVLRERAKTNNQLRLRDGRQLLPEESRLAQAMQQRPQFGAGVAAGVDRWVMLRLGRQSIREVMAFPAEQA